jgi:hypothetical protein
MFFLNKCLSVFILWIFFLYEYDLFVWLLCVSSLLVSYLESMISVCGSWKIAGYFCFPVQRYCNLDCKERVK